MNTPIIQSGMATYRGVILSSNDHIAYAWWDFRGNLRSRVLRKTLLTHGARSKGLRFLVPITRLIDALVRPFRISVIDTLSTMCLLWTAITGMRWLTSNVYFTGEYGEMIAALLPIFGLLMFMHLTPISRFHGAEHMVSNAETEVEEFTVDAVTPFTTIHDRCGTNLFGAILVTMPFLLLLPERYQLIAQLIVIFATIEIMSYLATKKSKWRFVIFWSGYLIQRLTTNQPNQRHIEAALEARRLLTDN